MTLTIFALKEDGNIVYANHYKLKNPGYEKEEYVSYYVAEFQFNNDCFDDMMTHLTRLEKTN